MKKMMVMWMLMGCGQVFAQGKPMEVVIQNVKNDKGRIMVALFISEETFRQKPWKGETTEAKPGTMKVTFKDVPSGEYAIAVYHDSNGNGKLDYNIIGRPSEGFGFSLDAMGKFGPPEYEKARIKWTGNEKFTINLIYY